LDNLNEEFKKLNAERKEILDKINSLEDDEKLKRYFYLTAHNKELISRQMNLYQIMKVKEYASCDHIWVHTLHEHDYIEGRSYHYSGCIKCGLDQKVFEEANYHPEYLPYDKKIMYDYMKKTTYDSGIHSEISCDLELGQAVYKKLKECNPDLDDESLLKFFEITIENIRDNIKTEEQKQMKRKEYSLSPKFDKWTSNDICK